VDLTETQLELLMTAWACAARGCGVVVQDECLGDAGQLAELGWFERRLDGDDVSWWWTAQPETALDVAKLTNVEGRKN
jgi:hypothetical protein